MIKQIICKDCYEKCVLDIDESNGSLFISGNNCTKGIEYAKKEKDNNKEIFTTLVRIKGGKFNVVPVKSTKPIDKALWIECSKALSRLYVGAPIKAGDIVCKNLLNTGVDIVSIKNIDKFI